MARESQPTKIGTRTAAATPPIVPIKTPAPKRPTYGQSRGSLSQRPLEVVSDVNFRFKGRPPPPSAAVSREERPHRLVVDDPVVGSAAGDSRHHLGPVA